MLCQNPPPIMQLDPLTPEAKTLWPLRSELVRK
jgi:hypothetical protein